MNRRFILNLLCFLTLIIQYAAKNAYSSEIRSLKHIVASGETLSSVSYYYYSCRLYGPQGSLEHTYRLNPQLKSKKNIFSGDVINISPTFDCPLRAQDSAIKAPKQLKVREISSEGVIPVKIGFDLLAGPVIFTQKQSARSFGSGSFSRGDELARLMSLKFSYNFLKVGFSSESYAVKAPLSTINDNESSLRLKNFSFSLGWKNIFFSRMLSDSLFFKTVGTDLNWQRFSSDYLSLGYHFNLYEDSQSSITLTPSYSYLNKINSLKNVSQPQGDLIEIQLRASKNLPIQGLTLDARATARRSETKFKIDDQKVNLQTQVQAFFLGLNYLY